MLITTNPWHIIMTGMLCAGWLTLVTRVVAQETAPMETTATIVTETSTATDTANTDATAPTVTTAPTATDAPTDQITSASVSPPAIEPQPTTTNISTFGFNSLPAATNAPPSDPRAADAPGWWFEAVLKQGGNYPAFLGVRFADASRAVIIETPNRKLTVGQPLVYRLWVCNDLPQAMACRVEHAIRKGELVISHTNTAGLMVKGSEARALDRFEQSTDALAPSTYTINATLRDQSGKLLHHMTETFEIIAKKSD